jgi:hypothetical protein
MIKSKLSVVTAGLTLLFLSSTAQAATILAPQSGAWEYTFVDPTAGAWNTTTGGGWATGAAPFGNCAVVCHGSDPLGQFNYNTLWNADGADGDDLWVRRAVDFTGYDLSTIAWDLGVDNGFKLYLNGVLVGGTNAEGYTFRWEYSGAFGAAALPGINILAVALEDHGGLTAFDMQITGTAVPEPGSTFALLLTGLGALGAGYRRSRAGKI